MGFTSVEVRLTSDNPASRLGWLVGGYFFNEALNFDLLATQINGGSFNRTIPEQKTRNYAGFGQLSYAVIDGAAAVRERLARLKALRAERTRVAGAIQNMFDLIEQGIVSPRDADFATRLANQRTRRADLEHEILLAERQLSMTDYRVTPEAIDRLGEVLLTKLRSNDSSIRQGYARRFIAKVVVAPDTITGPIKPLAIATDHLAPMVPSLDRKWCRLQDSNL